MYFLIDTCQHPDILRVLYFVYLLLDIVFVAIPIGLIIMLMIDFSKAVITGEEKEQIKSTKLVTKRIMYAVIIFIIPWVVNVLMTFIDTVGLDIGGDYMTCITNVEAIRNETKNFEYFDSLLEAEEEIEALNNSNNGNNSSPSNDNTASGTTFESAAASLVSTAVGELDNKYDAKYGGSVDGWCAAFVQWSLKNTYLSDRTMSIFDYINKDGYVSNPYAASGLWSAFQKSAYLDFEHGKAYDGDYTPKKGDIVWFQWDPDLGWSYCRKKYGKWDKVNVCSDHTAIVIDVNGDEFTTIDGNSGGKVKTNVRNVNSDTIIAYGVWYK